MTAQNEFAESDEVSMPEDAVKRLDALVGEWLTESFYPPEDPVTIRGITTYEWLPGGGFLIERSSAEDPIFPKGISLIGWDASKNTYIVHYFDSRGVARIYHMSLTKDEWRLWRDAPGFSQRFVGKFSEDRQKVNGTYELSTDGSTWQRDFDMNYTRISGR